MVTGRGRGLRRYTQLRHKDFRNRLQRRGASRGGEGTAAAEVERRYGRGRGERGSGRLGRSRLPRSLWTRWRYVWLLQATIQKVHRH